MQVAKIMRLMILKLAHRNFDNAKMDALVGRTKK